MDRTTFNLMSYGCVVGREVKTRHTFNTSGIPGARLAGKLIAPPGSRLRTGSGAAVLMVPKPGRDGEYFGLSPEEAVERACKGEMGLEFEAEGDL